MKHLLQFATSYNKNLSTTLDCILNLKKNKIKRKKIITLSFIILTFSVLNYILFTNTKTEDKYFFPFFIIIIVLIIIFKLGFFNLLILEFFKKETEDNLTTKLFAKNKIEIETSKNIKTNNVDITISEAGKPILQIETIPKQNQKKHLASPSTMNKVEIETNKNTETRNAIILELKKHNFVELMNPVCSEEILNLLLDYKIIDNNGEWISKKLKRNRDVALFIAKLFENNFLNTTNQADVCRKAKLFFDKNIDTGQFNKIKQSIDDDNIPTNDKESYQYLSFLDTIKIYN